MFSELNDFVIQLDEEVEGMQSTILTLQQQLKDVKQKVTQSQEETSQLKSRLDDTEKALAAVKAQRLDSQVGIHADTDQDICSTVSVSCQSPDVKTGSRTSEVESGSESDHDSSSGRILTSQNEDSCTNVPKPSSSTSSFSISKLLAPDTNETGECVTPEGVTREGVTQESVIVTPGKLENGQEGKNRDLFGLDLHSTTTPRLTSKGVADGMGGVGEIAAYNGEVVK